AARGGGGRGPGQHRLRPGRLGHARAPGARVLRDARNDEALGRAARGAFQGLPRRARARHRGAPQPGARVLRPREQILRPEPQLPARDRLPARGRGGRSTGAGTRSRGAGLGSVGERRGGLVRGWALSAAFTLAAGALALPASPARPQSLADTARVRRWREDLAFVVDRVTTVHPRPFAFSSRAAFDSAAAAIGQRIATTDDARLAADCMRLVASLGDGHTILIGTFPALGFDAVLPLWLRPCEDGLYVGAAGPPFARAAGAKVVSIGGVAADQALERVLAITSGDNRYTRLDRAPLFLMMPSLPQTAAPPPSPDR